MLAQIRKNWLALDLRSLALFRILLGLFVALDLLTHLSGVQAFYTDLGILPRSLVQWAGPNRIFCVFMSSGSAIPQVFWILFGVACSAFVILGLHTRTASFWCWFILASLHLRNHYSADRGCMMLEIMLFWGFFLPLDARWSLAARRSSAWKELPNDYRSPGSAALLLQLSMIYFFTGMMKSGPAWIVDGDAALMACRCRQVSTPYSEWLAHFPELLRDATFLTVAWEMLLGFCIISPIFHDRLRNLSVLTLLLFHIHNEFVFRLGYFPLMNASLALVILPSSCWDGRGRRIAAFLDRKLGYTPRLQADSQSPSAYKLSKAARAWLLICLSYCLYRNLAVVPDYRYPDMHEPMTSFGKLFRLEQQWNLFSPDPPTDFWFRLLAKDRQGQEVDLLQPDRVVTLDRPSSPILLSPVYFWRMVLFNCVSENKNVSELRQSLWNYWHRQYQGSYSDIRFELIGRPYNSEGHPLPPKIAPLWAPKVQTVTL